MSEKKKEIKTTAKEPVAAPVRLSPLEEAMKVAAVKLPKLYAKMEESDAIFTGPEIAAAIGLDPENPIHVQGSNLAWHKLFDAGVVPSSSFTKPVPVKGRRKRKLPTVV